MKRDLLSPGPSPSPLEPGASDELVRELAALQKEYADELPLKVAELAGALARARLQGSGPAPGDEARSLAHRLRGTAGAYGFHSVGELAGLIEDALPGPDTGAGSATPWAAVDEALAGMLRHAGTSKRDGGSGGG